MPAACHVALLAPPPARSAASNIKVTDTPWPADDFTVDGELTASYDSIPVGTSVQHRWAGFCGWYRVVVCGCSGGGRQLGSVDRVQSGGLKCGAT